MDDEGVYSSNNNTLTIQQNDVSGIESPTNPAFPTSPVVNNPIAPRMQNPPYDSHESPGFTMGRNLNRETEGGGEYFASGPQKGIK